MKGSASQDMKMETLFLIHKIAPVGVPINEDDYNKAYKIVHTKALIETVKWMQQNMTINRSY